MLYNYYTNALYVCWVDALQKRNTTHKVLNLFKQWRKAKIKTKLYRLTAMFLLYFLKKKMTPIILNLSLYFQKTSFQIKYRGKYALFFVAAPTYFFF